MEILTNIIFWPLWLVEFGGVCWWIKSELKYKFLKTNIFSWMCFGYLFLVLGIKTVLKWHLISLVMILLPGIPPLLYLMIMWAIINAMAKNKNKEKTT